MLRTNCAILALSFAALLTALSTSARAQSISSYNTPNAINAPSTSGQTAPTNIPTAELQRPAVNIPPTASRHFEKNPILTLPEMFAHQWSPAREVAPEEIISERYLRTQDSTVRELSLKQAIYIALRNNPALEAQALTPMASTESVNLANASFDPDLTSQLDVQKSVTPVTSPFETTGTAFTQKLYDWDFGLNKVSSITGGTVGVTFNNNRTLTNSDFSSVNPSYTPQLTLSLEQPLLRNFGWKFATINVRLAQSAQRQSQWQYGSALNDFVQRVGQDYWSVVAGEENLAVAQAALKFNRDLVRVNRISVRVGTLAPIDLQEAESAASTAEANVFAAEATLKSAIAALRQDVMLNPAGTFVPEEIEPSERPNTHLRMNENEETALEAAVQFSPALGGLREAIRTSLLQVKFAQNQTLPQLNIGAQYGQTSVAGTTPCITKFGSGATNCTTPAALPGDRLPFGGIYGDALNHLLEGKFYDYAAVLNFEMPLDNAPAKAALAQARITYEQARMQYRAAISEMVYEVQSALANLHADEQSVIATRNAVFFAEQSLHDEQIEFRVGMATTHDLLQFQSELVTAQGNQVASDVSLEDARLTLWHAEGTLLNHFDINFEIQRTNHTPWFAHF
ncbi:MAG: TolC family protein [Candidatus Binataceae bacterium]